MKKSYRAYGSVVSLGVYAHGRNMRAEFAPVSNYDGMGGSIYITEDEEVQEALEKRADYGQLFVLVDNKSWDEQKDGASDAECQTQDTVKERELKTVKVESIADAKIWLMDNCGWKPASRVTKKGLTEAAEAYGVVFEGV